MGSEVDRWQLKFADAAGMVKCGNTAYLDTGHRTRQIDNVGSGHVDVHSDPNDRLFFGAVWNARANADKQWLFY